MVKTSREVGLEVNTETSNYMFVSRHHNAGQNHNLLIGNEYSDNGKCGKVQVFGNNRNK
jgi:hypothetical protein